MENSDNPRKTTRRKFIEKLFVGGGLLASALLLLRHGVSYVFPSMDSPPMRKLLIGRTGDLKSGEAKEVQVGDNLLYLVRDENGFKVLSSVCTHLGCKVNWEAHRNRFYCPCHKGIFNASGNVIEGPPPRSLDEYKVAAENNLIYIWIENKSGSSV